MLIVIGWVLWVAPLGVFALSFAVGAGAGGSALGAVAHYVVLISLLGVGITLVGFGIAVFGARIGLGEFTRGMIGPAAVAVSTRSSLASLPAMLTAARRLGVDDGKADIILPMAVALFRATGPAMNVGVVVYVAHWLGVEISLWNFVAGIAVATMASIGAVSLPGQVSFVTSIAPISIAMGVPIEPLALLIAVEAGGQGVMMAPTEILARQHYRSFQQYLEPLGARVELLIGAMGVRARREARARIEGGDVDIVIGTQALIQEGVNFYRLGLVVIDEEHRFGVNQRRALLLERPDVLVMSATPIPRSLALTAYGDLELTIIDELPPGRTPISTKLLLDTHRRQAYTFAMQQIEQGRQAYVVAPLVEESEKLEEVLAATQLAEDLKQILPNARVDLLHGKMPADQKDDVMNRFRAREFDLLVSTTVIEVGVDVPNATIIIIENAERFGLSQLHQLRGRVGRGADQSYCLMVAGDHSKKTKERLKIIESTTDGFKIAEADLRLRGPGEIRGTRQSGMPDLRLGDIANDVEIIEKARNLAKQILAVDPKLELPQTVGLRVELKARGEQAFITDVI